ncbi:MAG: hypothetical protein CSA21_05290 [Deltaproteobacteria bacterium]|nr:MAG: hypothetical protein CSA21_05290 [Deltaproteobacteria bacterium]
MKVFSLVNAGILVVLLFFSGCAEKPESSVGAGSLEKSPAEAATFAYVTFHLPQQIDWVQSQNTPTADGGGIAEWVPQKYVSQVSPLRVVYQKKPPGVSPEARLQEILEPIKECADVKVHRFSGKSSYGYQANVEVFCSKMGKNDWGLISYVTVFSNRRESHVLFGEIRTVPTEKAGIFPAKTVEEKKTAAEIQQLSKLLFDMAGSVRVCEDDGSCR